MGTMQLSLCIYRGPFLRERKLAETWQRLGGNHTHGWLSLQEIFQIPGLNEARDPKSKEEVPEKQSRAFRSLTRQRLEFGTCQGEDQGRAKDRLNPTAKATSQPDQSPGYWPRQEWGEPSLGI